MTLPPLKSWPSLEVGNRIEERSRRCGASTLNDPFGSALALYLMTISIEVGVPTTGRASEIMRRKIKSGLIMTGRMRSPSRNTVLS